MRKDTDNHGLLLDVGDNLQVASTLRAMFDIVVESALEQARSLRGQFLAKLIDLEIAPAIR